MPTWIRGRDGNPHMICPGPRYLIPAGLDLKLEGAGDVLRYGPTPIDPIHIDPFEPWSYLAGSERLQAIAHEERRLGQRGTRRQRRKARASEYYRRWASPRFIITGVDHEARSITLEPEG